MGVATLSASAPLRERERIYKCPQQDVTIFGQQRSSDFCENIADITELIE